MFLTVIGELERSINVLPPPALSNRTEFPLPGTLAGFQFALLVHSPFAEPVQVCPKTGDVHRQARNTPARQWNSKDRKGAFGVLMGEGFWLVIALAATLAGNHVKFPSPRP